MSSPTLKTIKRLFAESGNQCAFAGCNELLCNDAGAIVGEICHIKASRKDGPRYDFNQTAQERNAYDNLILLCPNHHTCIDTNPDNFPAESLIEMKSIKKTYVAHPETSEDALYAKQLLEKFLRQSPAQNIMMNSPGAIQANTVTIKTTMKNVIVAPAPDTIGHDQRKSRYIEHLIERYNKFASTHYTRSKPFEYGAIGSNIVSKFGSKWRMLPVERFEQVASYLQDRISKTKQAKCNQSKQYPSFSTYEEYCIKHLF